MPVPNSPNNLTAVIGFTLPQSRMDHDENIYLNYRPGISKPTEKIRVPIKDLRSELESSSLVEPLEQLKKRGYAIMKHDSKYLNEIPSVEGTNSYLEECKELLKNMLGCDKVIAWNSVCRKNNSNIEEKKVIKQKKPEIDFLPIERIQPIASVAHVDQNSEWGLELCGKASGKDASQLERCQIINIWRPLHGPVTNAPLAMVDPKTLLPEDIGTHASQFGFGHDLHYSSKQEWSYIRHQMPNEIIFLKCFDSDQGKNGEVLWCGHVAVQVDNDTDGIDQSLIRDRESIEVRLVALWE